MSSPSGVLVLFPVVNNESDFQFRADSISTKLVKERKQKYQIEHFVVRIQPFSGKRTWWVTIGSQPCGNKQNLLLVQNLCDCSNRMSFLGDLNLVPYIRHQEAKSVNASLKVFYLFDFGHVWFFRSLSGCS